MKSGEKVVKRWGGLSRPSCHASDGPAKGVLNSAGSLPSTDAVNSPSGKHLATIYHTHTPSVAFELPIQIIEFY